jgi:hypothetical protein
LNCNRWVFPPFSCTTTVNMNFCPW